MEAMGSALHGASCTAFESFRCKIGDIAHDLAPDFDLLFLRHGAGFVAPQILDRSFASIRRPQIGTYVAKDHLSTAINLQF